MRLLLSFCFLLGCEDKVDATSDTAAASDSAAPDDTAAVDTSCDDSDADGVCDEEDACPGKDDGLDSDSDGVPDCLDDCPQDAADDSDGDGICDSDDACPLDNPDDSDGDGICDSDDACPDGDDAEDSDGDGVCDTLDACPGGDDSVDKDNDGVPDDCATCEASKGWGEEDLDGDGLPDDCLLSVLLIEGHDWTAENIETILLARGWDVTTVLASKASKTLNFSAFDVVAVGYNVDAADIEGALKANAAGEVGVVIHRGGDSFSLTGLGSSTFYQSGDCTVDDDTHFITSTLGSGAVDVEYTYKTIVNSVETGAQTLVSCTSPSLVLHPTLRRLTTLHYGHDDGMPWASDGELIDLRSYAWAAGFGDL